MKKKEWDVEYKTFMGALPDKEDYLKQLKALRGLVRPAGVFFFIHLVLCGVIAKCKKAPCRYILTDLFLCRERRKYLKTFRERKANKLTKPVNKYTQLCSGLVSLFGFFSSSHVN